RRAEARAVACRAGERLDKAARRVPVNQRAPRHHVVDKGVAVDVRETAAGGAADEERRAAHRLEGANGAIDAAGENLQRAGKKSGGSLCTHHWLSRRHEGHEGARITILVSCSSRLRDGQSSG